MSLAVRLMPTTGTGRRPSRSSDGQGGWVLGAEAAWAITAPGVPCKYDPGSTSEPVVGDQQRGEHRGRLFVELGTDVRRGDLWTLADGRRLEVLAVKQPGGSGVGGAGGHKVCEVLELQPDNRA